MHANTVGYPRAVMVHLEHTCIARRAMMSAIRLARLAFLAIACLAVGLDGEGTADGIGVTW